MESIVSRIIGVKKIYNLIETSLYGIIENYVNLNTKKGGSDYL